jgi:hypothetical protein
MSDPPESEDSGNGVEPSQTTYGTPFQAGPPAMAPYNWQLQHEQGWHRGAAFLAAHGAGINKIARALDRTRQTVSNLFRQRFFQEMVREEMALAQRDIRALFRDELLNNLEVLKEIRDDRNELASPRIMSIREINDRALGRPVQPNESANEFVPSANPVEEVERLEREVEQLSAQRLRGELPPANASE